MKTLGLLRTDKHDYYFTGQDLAGEPLQVGPFPSVTDALRVIDKPAIGTWAKQETAKCALRNWDMLADMRVAGGDDAAVAWLSRIPDYQRDVAARLGSSVHRLFEMAMRGGQIAPTDEEAPFVDAAAQFIADYTPKIESLEKSVINVERQYGGTYDLLLKLDGERWLVDLKTSKGVYGETALQLAAYQHAEFIGLPGDPRPRRMPKIDRFAVLHLRPEAYPGNGYRLIEYRVGPDEWRAFLAALALRRWQQGAHPVGEEVARSYVKKRVPRAAA
jgi:hypothetical protein